MKTFIAIAIAFFLIVQATAATGDKYTCTVQTFKNVLPPPLNDQDLIAKHLSNVYEITVLQRTIVSRLTHDGREYLQEYKITSDNLFHLVGSKTDPRGTEMISISRARDPKSNKYLGGIVLNGHLVRQLWSLLCDKHS